MRLWHIKLIPYLPKSQLVAQWRELNSIFVKENKHILINYVYDNKHALFTYTREVIKEMDKRGIEIKSVRNYDSYVIKTSKENGYWFQGKAYFKEHDFEYLTICYYNLKEKWMRGQKDFTRDMWFKIHNFYKEEIEKVKEALRNGN